MWGTRGSQATPGNETVRYGGNTSCVEVRATADTAIVLDAGTGIRRLGHSLPPEVVRVDVLLTHLHMDHIQGLGFFELLHRPGYEVHIWGPGSATVDLRTRLTRYMSPPLFPVRLNDLACDLHVHDINEGAFEIPGVDVRTALVCHPGPTVGYRLEDDDGTVAYLPDHEPALASHRFAYDPEWCSGLELAAGVDLLIHDAQYSPEEYENRVGWGHSTLEQALAFAELARVGRFVPFHHDPEHDDDMLDDFFGDAPVNDLAPFVVSPAHEGDVFEVGSPRYADP
jgi:phosphoribosyl 1,2-cyclic phosphodiesterase